MQNKKVTEVYLLGHRGARAEILENSELGFAFAKNLTLQGKKLDGVEFDVQITADGEFVVVHDETLGRLVNNQSWIADKKLSELHSVLQSDFLRYQADFNQDFIGQKILCLSDLLPYLQSYRHIELEIKTHAKTNPQRLVKNLLRLLLGNNNAKNWQALPITLTSFDTEVLYQLQNQQSILPFEQRFATGLLLEPTATLASQIAFFPLPNKDGEKLMYHVFNQAKALSCVQVGVYFALITPSLVEIANRFGLKVTAWTVNDVDTAQKLVNMGVDCVITDFPTRFLTVKK